MIALNKIMSINVNYPTGLFVGMKIFRDVGLGPVQVGGVVAMTNVSDTLYIASYTPTIEGAYTFAYGIYTDGTYTALRAKDGRGAICEQVVEINASNLDLLAIKAVTDQFVFNIDGAVESHVINQTALDPDDVAAAVWDAPLVDHDDAGSFGANAQNPPLDADAIADAVLDAAIADHLNIGSVGEKINSGGGSGGEADITIVVEDEEILEITVDDEEEITVELEEAC